MTSTTTFWGQNVLPFQDLEQLEFTYTLVGVWISLNTSENHLVSTKAEHMCIPWLRNFTPRYIPNINVYTYAPEAVNKFMAAQFIFIIVTNWKQFKCPATVEWVNKLWYIPMKEFYKAIRINKVLLHAI